MIFGIENTSFALHVGKNAKPIKPGFCTAQTQVFGFVKRLGNPGL